MRRSSVGVGGSPRVGTEYLNGSRQMARVVIRVAFLLIALCSIAASPLVAQSQIITTNPTMATVAPSQAVPIDVFYDASDDDNTTAGVVVRLHYDPTQVDLDLGNGYDNEIPNPGTGVTASYKPAQADAANDDGDPLTTAVVIVTYADGDATPSFPSVDLTAGAVRLFTANFNT